MELFIPKQSHLTNETLIKLWKIMRLTVVFLVAIALHVNARSYSQNVTLNVAGITLKEAFIRIEEQTSYSFFINQGLLEKASRVDLTLNDASIVEAMEQCMKGQLLTYNIKDGIIYIKESKKRRQPVRADTTVDVSGRVTDVNGGLYGVSIVVQGTTRGTITDPDGSYSISGVPADAVLVFSFIGMKTQMIRISGRQIIDVVMEEETLGLEELVVIGYGQMKKSDLTGSVASVTAEDLMAYPTSQALQALQGRAAGLHVQATNGDPGSAYKIRIRGASSVNSSSDPLIVVDGFPGAFMPASEDIESVEILKDASATAIYGSRGANGVILITTRSGVAGQTRIEFNTSYSTQNVIKKLDLLHTPDFVDYINDMSPGKMPDIDYPDTDWQDEVFQQGAVQNYQLSLSGGSDQARYYISGILYDQKGVVLDSRFKRYSILSSVDLEISKNLKAGVQLLASRNLKDGTVTQEWSGGAGQTGVISATILSEPTIPVYNEDGTYTTSKLTGLERDNPVAIAKETVIDNVSDNLQANFFGEYQITRNLKFRSTFGAQSTSSRDGNYLPSSMFGGRSVNGRGYINSSRSTDIINENYFTFDKEINDVHDFSLMAGYSYQWFRSEFWHAQSENYISDAFSYWNLGGGSVAKAPSSTLIESTLASFYGRVNYRLFDRYLVTFNARYDGSSRFAKNNKWAFFPSGAIAWNIAQESFMEGVPQISQLKLRASYGMTGNQAIGPYQSLALLGTLPSVVINNTVVNAVVPQSVANDNLTWESTVQTDVGVDLGLFGQRISLTADYYHKKTSDLLFSMPLPKYSGYSSMLKNIGAILNEGFEFNLSTVNVEGDFTWVTDINVSRNRNEILELPDGKDIFVNVSPGHLVGINNSQVLREGHPMGQFFGYVYDGVYQEGDDFLPGGGFEQVAGGEKFRDINGKDANGALTGLPDGQLNADDRAIIGDPNPDFTWGLNNTFRYKGFDLNIFFQGSQGNDLYSFMLLEMELMSGYNNSTVRALDRWTPTHTDTDVPAASTSRSKKSSSRFVYDGSYIRMKNISLGYTLPESFIRGAGMSFARIYVSGQNLLTITDYPGYDPEVSWFGATSNINLGLDYGSYPNAKSVTIGAQVRF